MREIRGTLTEALEDHVGMFPVGVAEAHAVPSYRRLVEEVARLAYLNKDYMLFFRGQGRDYLNKGGASTFYPSLYRGERLAQAQVELSFDILESAASRLCDALEREGNANHRDVRRRRYIQWSILQHYEVCTTPLLDFTHSLRVACSFAYIAAEEEHEPFVFVFGLPYVTNRISVNSEHDLVNVRLLSICPPVAIRPYFQEGYLAGTDEVTSDYDDKTELDFNRRLIAKFRLTRGKSFWRGGFEPLPEKVLYPNGDWMENLCVDLRSEVGTGPTAGRVGEFLQHWTDFESTIMSAARDVAPETKVYSLHEALEVLKERSVLPMDIIQQLHDLRRLRNDIVHRPARTGHREVLEAIGRLQGLRADVRMWDL